MLWFQISFPCNDSDKNTLAELTTALRAVACTLAAPSLLAIAIASTLTAMRCRGWWWWRRWCWSRWSRSDGVANGTKPDLGKRCFVIALVAGWVRVAWSNLAPTVATIHPRHAPIGSYFLIIPCAHCQDHSISRIFHHLIVRPQPITSPLIKSQCAVLLIDVRPIERIEVGALGWFANIQGWKSNVLTILGVKSFNAIAMELSCDSERFGRIKLVLRACTIPTLIEPGVTTVPRARAIAKRIHAATTVITNVVFAL